MSSIAYSLRERIYDSLLFDGFVQRLEYFPNRDLFSSFFPAHHTPSREMLGPKFLLINIRANEILTNIHPDYHPLPLSYWEELANISKLEPVIMGQLGNNKYSEEVRSRFHGCYFFPKQSPVEDFETIRNATNIAVSVSSFSWLAAWLSRTAQTIYLPVSGFLNPIQRRDVDLLPVNDPRYKFFIFPVGHWQSTPSQHDDLYAAEKKFKSVAPGELKPLITIPGGPTD
jgi:hypothetical protein